MNKRARSNYKQNITAINNGAVFSAVAFERFKGAICDTSFANKDKNPANKKGGPRKGMKSNEPVKMTPKSHI